MHKSRISVIYNIKGEWLSECVVPFMASAGYEVLGNPRVSVVAYDLYRTVDSHRPYPRFHGLIPQGGSLINLHFDAKRHQGLASVSSVNRKATEDELLRLVELARSKTGLGSSDRRALIACFTDNMLFGTADYLKFTRLTVAQEVVRYSGKQYHGVRSTRAAWGRYSRSDEKESLRQALEDAL